MENYTSNEPETANETKETPLDTARDYTQRGWKVIPINYKSKKIFEDGWQNWRLTENDLPKHFKGKLQNIGVLLGEPSNNLIDIDLDCEEAVQLAPMFLPKTTAIYGRNSKRRSHYEYYVNEPIESEKFQDHTREKKSAMVVELRSTGLQTVFPGSVHESGEKITWDENGEPATVDAEELRAAVDRLHKAVLVMRGIDVESKANQKQEKTNVPPNYEPNHTNEFKTFGERNNELINRIRPHAKLNKKGLLETHGICHGGESSKTALFANPQTGKVFCHGGCSYEQILRSFGLPDVHLPKFVNSSNSSNSYPVNKEIKNESKSFPVLSDAALSGLAGEIVRKIEPHTEAHPAALLTNVLAIYGCSVGFSPFYQSADKQGTNVFVVHVGKTGRAGRKGTSLAPVKYVFEQVDKEMGTNFINDNIQNGGIGSGEGILNRLRDANGDDAGVEDKRLMLIIEELNALFSVMRREGSTLGDIVKLAFDRRTISQSLSDSRKCKKVTNPHIAIIGQITNQEFRGKLTEDDKRNGFANRFFPICIERTKKLPHSGGFYKENIVDIVSNLKNAIEFANDLPETMIDGETVAAGELIMDDDAKELWEDFYYGLDDTDESSTAAMMNRAEPITLRFACIYALLDKSRIIRRQHLTAAIAVFDYAKQSVRYIFGDGVKTSKESVENRLSKDAQKLLLALKDAENGLSKTDISKNVFQNNSAGRVSCQTRIQNALSELQKFGLVRFDTTQQHWFAVPENESTNYEFNELNELYVTPIYEDWLLEKAAILQSYNPKLSWNEALLEAHFNNPEEIESLGSRPMRNVEGFTDARRFIPILRLNQKIESAKLN